MERLKGRKAIVTGAAQGLGEALLERIAREGYRRYRLGC
jgi:NAD(P)-dependent dehydrogenase (short-subunit alcohol dehydrogenase family)